MKYLILLATLAFVKGQTDPPPVGIVTCNPDHTVDITIVNVFDVPEEWSEAEWQLENNPECEPTFSADTVTYNNLVLPNCSRKALEVDDNSTITYVLVISVAKTAGNPQLRSYDHLYYVWCMYYNTGDAIGDFEPVVNKADNDSSNGFFTFDLDVFNDPGFTTAPSTPIGLDQTLYVRALVQTHSAAPNLDLFLANCWTSSTTDVMSNENRVDLIADGCGNTVTSEDYKDTLDYSCVNDDVQENFEIQSFRFFGADPGDSVFFHCILRVCLADNPTSACECPGAGACPAVRKRRSVGEYVEEIHVKSGPYYFADEKKDEGELKEQDKPQSLSTNMAIVVAVSGVVVVAVIVCATVFFVVRSRNKRGQKNDLNVVT